MLPLYVSKSLLAWLQQEAHSAISFHDIQWHLGVVNMPSMYLLFSLSQHLESKIVTNTHEKISTEVSEFTLDYWGQKVYSHRPLAKWAANILLVFYPHSSVNAFVISKDMHQNETDKHREAKLLVPNRSFQTCRVPLAITE